MTILIATLGATWQVIPEIAGLVLPDACPLYRHHPQQAGLELLRAQCGNPAAAATQLWVITSSSRKTYAGIEKIRAWNQQLPIPINITFFIAAQTDEVTSAEELHALQELVFRVMLKASEMDQVVCSLAGGRKTMSADLQHAASLLGAQALLHVVAPEPLPAELKSDDAQFWASPLSAQLGAQLLPAFIGRYQRRETLDITPAITAALFNLPHAAGDTVLFANEQGGSLVAELISREHKAGELLNNYLADVAQGEQHENWRHLYRFSPRVINRLKNERVNCSHRQLINALPKAELHCHLGGIPTLDEQIAIGASIWQGLSEQRRTQLKAQLHPLLSLQEWSWDWPSQFIRIEPNTQLRAERAACLLTQASRAQLEFNLYTATQPRCGLSRSAKGFSAYERPGELTGSSVLGHPGAIRAYVAAVHAYTQRENIVYLELRGSPHKYNPQAPLLWLQTFYDALEQHKASCEYRFIWILDRNRDDLGQVVQQAVATRNHAQLKRFVVGLDLAGDESKMQPEQVAPYFKPAFADCLPITIHAGEGQPAENIWQAAYHLHADRIGHGLSLVDHTELLARFRNRNICLELCPTSNQEVIGFYSPGQPQLPVYPLERLWHSGVALCINTDNPGISRTGLTDEFLVAASTWEAMSLWDCLALIKQAFVHAMAEASERERWLKEYDQKIYSIIQAWLDAH